MANEKCGKCQRSVKENDDGLKCETCEQWYHTECENVAQELYKILQKYEDQMWFCGDCKNEVRGNIQKVKELERKNEEMDAKMKILEERWDKLREDMIEEVTGKVKEEISRDIVQQTTENVLSHLKEEGEKKQKKENIIMYNVNESEKENTEEKINDDLEKVRDVIESSLGVREYTIEKIIRLGRRENNRTRPLLIKFRNEKEKWDVIKNAKNLKHETDEVKKRIGISMDLTEKQREHERKLVAELKERKSRGEQGLYIKNGKLCKAEERR